jgi:uncharacterized protein YbaA (DUF1428 family)
MAKYVDGFVFVVANDKADEYKKMAEQGRDIWMRLGALEYYECRGDDMNPPDMGGMKARAFPEMAGAKNGETVWFSFIVFKSKAHRDEVNAKMMEEMNKQMEGKKEMTMPFDMRRMAYGGFEVVVEK